ncbi:hypothetical protein SCUP515_11171 [Seiridium cupressi]
MADSQPLRVGFVPEHFSTPIHFAKKHFGLSATLIPFPSGTGHMITALRTGEIDVGIGLTEAWVAGLGKEDTPGDGGYRIVGTYVETPLCWAISTGAKRPEISSVDTLKGSKIGISRLGSGSQVMGYVLADQQGWLSSSSSPYADFVILQTFDKLRNAVNDGTADFFMWEHFTSKRYYDSGEIRKVGEIYTPWSSWKIVASTSTTKLSADARLKDLFKKLDQGTKYFIEHHDEAVRYISTELDYSEEDAREWLKTVEFAREVAGVDVKVIESCIASLRKAGVLKEEKGLQAQQMLVQGLGEQLPAPREAAGTTATMSLPRALQSRLPNLSSVSSPILRRSLLRPRRPQARFESTKPTPSQASDITAKQASRFDRVVTRTQRWLPKRFHTPLDNFRSAPGSHIVAFLMIHELTAILPLFGLVAAFQYYDIVPAGYVFGPWAPYVQEGAFKFLRWFRKRGFFGLGAEGAKEGEERFEEDLGREAEREGKGQSKGVFALWSRLRGQQKDGVEGEVEEVAEKAKSKTRRALELAREKVTLNNTEAGYKVGVQLVAAYAIVKVLLIPRIAFSLWVTPSFARAMIWARKGLIKR